MNPENVTGHNTTDNPRSGAGYFVVVASIAAMAAFLTLSRTLHGYVAECSVLVIPGTHAQPSSEIVNDVVFLSRTSGFREQLFQDEKPYITAEAGNMTADARRSLLDASLSMSSTGTPNVISVRAYSDDPIDADGMARTASLSLFRFVSRYYDVREMADFRIVDGPFAVSRALSVPSLLSASIAIGMAVATILLAMLSVIGRYAGFRSGRDTSAKSVSASPFGADIFLPKRPVSPLLEGTVSDAVPPMEREESEETRNVPDASPESSHRDDSVRPAENDSFFEPEPVHASSDGYHGKKAPAPLDIPTYSEEEERFLKEFSFEVPEEAEGPDAAADAPEATAIVPERVETVADAAADGDDVSTAPSAHETPSQAEFRRRLNELLRG